MRLAVLFCAVGLTAFGLNACRSTSVFTPKSAYPPDPWVKGYSDPDDCIGGEKLAAVTFDLPDYPKGSFRSAAEGPI